MALWCSDCQLSPLVIASFKKTWNQGLLKFKSCSSSNPVRDSRWWGSLTMFRFEISSNVFCWSIIPQKQFNTIISIIIIIVISFLLINSIKKRYSGIGVFLWIFIKFLKLLFQILFLIYSGFFKQRNVEENVNQFEKHHVVSLRNVCSHNYYLFLYKYCLC